MKITDYFLQNPGQTFISFEVLPPMKGVSVKSIYDILDPLMEFKPPFVDVTYHREDFEYVKRESGYYEKVAMRKRPGTVGICAAIQFRYGINAVPHLICGGFKREETENALIDLHFLGIRNVLALRGDSRRFETAFIPEPGGNAYAIDLVRQISGMNQGKYLDENIQGAATDFCIGIAGYPEKHFEAANMEVELQWTKAKVEAGADYIVTQMFFDNARFFQYVEQCRAIGIHVPIIPGLKPVTRKSQLKSLPRSFFVNFPADLVRDMEAAPTDQAVKEIGIEWCVQQSKELKAAGVPNLHYYTMGDVATTRRICERVF